VQLDAKLTFRRGLAEDLPQVREVSKDVWDGHDYMPHIWEEIVKDPELAVFVLEIEGQIAGFYCLQTLQSEKGRSGYWRGVRVATPFKGRGLAGRMVEHAIAESKAQGFYELTYSTADNNSAMHRLGERFGFRYVALFTHYQARPLAEKSQPEITAQFRPLTPAEFELGWAYTQTTPDWKKSEATYADDWIWKHLDRTVFRKRLEKAQVYGTFEVEGLQAIAMFDKTDWDGEPVILLEWLDGTAEALTPLVRHLYQQANFEALSDQKAAITAMLVANQSRDQILQENGFLPVLTEFMRYYELELKVRG